MSYSPVNCASMFQANNSTVTTISVIDTWYQVENFNAGTLNNWDFSNNTLIANSGAGGEYILQYHVCFIGAKDDTYEFAFAINDVIKDETLNMKYSDIESEELAISGNACLRIYAEDEIKLKVRNRTNGGNGTIIHSNVAIHRVI